jgi:predicted ATPase
MDTRPFLGQVAIRNFKSIRTCEVLLKKRTILVGRNGAGKSNFLDAVHFVADALQGSLDQAIRVRGGINSLGGQPAGARQTIAIRLEYTLPYNQWARYAIELTTLPNHDFEVSLERLLVYDSSGRTQAEFHRSGSSITRARTILDDRPVMPPVRKDRLYLVNAAGLPVFSSAYDALVSVGFYNLNPKAMREVRSAASEELLLPDGSNIASVIGRLAARSPETVERINRYLGSIVPGIESVEHETAGPGDTLVFAQRAEHPPLRRFYPENMSDGTLRALGILVASMQRGRDGSPIRLAAIEEPENALHPAAAGALMDALREASAHTQVLLTSHSSDLLDQMDMDADALLVVTSRGGISRITSADAVSLEAIKQHLYTPGDLLRMDQLQFLESDYERQKQLPFLVTTTEVS